MRFGTLLITTMLASGMTAALAQQNSRFENGGTNSWQRYVVPGASASVDIPGFFEEDPERPKDGYGARFFTKDGRANLTVRSYVNDAHASPANFLARLQPPSNIIFRRVTPRFFAVSSKRNDTIWYDRCNAAGRYMNCVLINYPAAEKRQWDGIVTRISRTLSGAS